MKKTTIILTSLLLMSLITLTGCSKEDIPQNITNETIQAYDDKIENYLQNMTQIEIAKETGLILDHEEFKEEMRETKQVIKVKEITTPEVTNWLHRRKNITPDTIICYGDQDCPQPYKCVAQCEWIGEGDMKGTVRACRMDEWKDDKNMKFMYPVGFCLEWTYQQG